MTTTYHSRANEVAEKLLGTCDYLSKHASDDEMNNSEFCATLDKIALECDECGWWWSSDEIENCLCPDCQ